MVDSRIDPLEATLMGLNFVATWVLPGIYIFSAGLNFASYSLPAVFGWLGVVLYLLALWMIWRAHADLGKNWSPTLEIVQGQKLVTSGIYAIVRHPIYAGMWLAMIGQALLLHNWVAGLAGIVAYAPIFFTRTPREEKMMIDQFGGEYQAYMRRTGGIFPHFERR